MNLLNRFDLFLVRKIHKFSIFYEKKYHVKMRDTLLVIIWALVVYHFQKFNDFPSIFSLIFALYYTHLLFQVYASEYTLRSLQINANGIRVFLYELTLLSITLFIFSYGYLSVLPKEHKVSSAEIYFVGLPLVISKLVVSNIFNILSIILIYLIISVLETKNNTDLAKQKWE